MPAENESSTFIEKKDSANIFRLIFSLFNKIINVNPNITFGSYGFKVHIDGFKHKNFINHEF